MPKGLYKLDPVKDPRWPKFVLQHPKASVFHTVEWLQALQSTYGYQPVAYTACPPTSELRNAIVFCGIQSWLTGNRLVSLPFSDHCEPLCDSGEELDSLIQYLKDTRARQNLRYLEVRPIDRDFGQIADKSGFKPASRYFLHILNLRPQLDELFHQFDKDCVQRRVQRAERGGLEEKCGKSEELVKAFYEMFVATRARHFLPPIPYIWFRNLVRCLGDNLEVRMAFKDGVPLAAILMLRFKDTIYYKYGCSDARFNGFGATPWLLWKAIVAAKLNHAIRLDMGRTEEKNTGLSIFKNHWVPEPKLLTYWKFPERTLIGSLDGWKLKTAKRVFSYMPTALLRITGRLVYRHIG